MRLILASNSKTRKDIFDLIGGKYDVVTSKQESFENIKKMSEKVNYAVTGVTIKDLYND